MNSTDDLAADCLRKHFILKKISLEKYKKVSNGYTKFGIYLSCLNDDDQFYHQFLKGMLIIFNYVLKKIIYINITTNKACGEIQSIH
jgi:hypothetical protein